MLTSLLHALRGAGLRVGLAEWLTLLEGLSKGLGTLDVDRFHGFARLCLVKDEALYDRFDRAFGAWWDGREAGFDALLDAFGRELPEHWLTPDPDAALDAAARAALEAAGGWDELMRTLAERLAEQRGAHRGGNRWIGTGGTSPFGQAGSAPAGVRIGEGAPGTGRAVKRWAAREYRELDGAAELGARNLRLALRALRRLAREGRADALDLDGTIRATAAGGGLLDVRLRAELRNTVKVLLLIDVGGSMDEHARTTEALFAAARAEFRRLEVLYFHNAPYERVWRTAARRAADAVTLDELTRTRGPEHRLFLVGDATMSPWEIVMPGGSVEHWNEAPSTDAFARLQRAFPHQVWLNPTDPARWERTPSIRLVRDLMHGRMHALGPDGLNAAVRSLRRPIPPPAAAREATLTDVDA